MAESTSAIQPIEVQAALMCLVRDMLVDVLLFDETQDDYVSSGPGIWPERPRAEMSFDLTGRGRVRYLNWDD